MNAESTPPAAATPHDIQQVVDELSRAVTAATPPDWSAAEAYARWIAAAAIAQQARTHAATMLPVSPAAARHVAFSRHECPCGEQSGWFDPASPEAPTALWDAAHAQGTGHATTYLWTITRQLAEIWGIRRPRA